MNLLARTEGRPWPGLSAALIAAVVFAGTADAKGPMVLHAHRSGVVDIAWHPKGGVIVSAGSDGVVYVWNPSASKPEETLKGFKKEALSLAFRTPAGDQLAVGDDAGRVLVFETEKWKKLRTLTGLGGERVDLLRYSPDGTYLAAASGKRVTVFSMPDFKAIGSRDLGPMVVQIAWSPASDALLAASIDGTASLWSMNPSEPKLDPVDHRTGLSDVVFAPDGGRFATCDGHGNVRIWDRVTGALIAEPMPATGVRAWGIDWSPDGGFLAVVGADGAVTLVSTADGTIFKRYEPKVGVVRKVAFSPDGRFLAAASTGHVHVWRTDTGKRVGKFGGHKEAISSMRWSPDSGFVATSSDDDRVRIWDLGGK